MDILCSAMASIIVFPLVCIEKMEWIMVGKQFLYSFEGAQNAEALASRIRELRSSLQEMDVDISRISILVDDAAFAHLTYKYSAIVNGFDLCRMKKVLVNQMGCDGRDDWGDKDICPVGIRQVLDESNAPCSSVVDMGDMGTKSMDEINDALTWLSTSELAAEGHEFALLWSDDGVEESSLQHELFVIGRLASVRLAYAQCMGNRSSSNGVPIYVKVDNSAKSVASLVRDGMFDGIYCESETWPCVKFASLADRILEENAHFAAAGRTVF